jgi:hypothetical protein
MDSEQRNDAGYLVTETVRLLGANAVLAAAAVGLLTGIGVVSDLMGDFGRLVNFAYFLASLILQYEITLRLLGRYGFNVDRRARRRLWALFGLNLVSSVGIIIGLVLLVLPGLYLIVRWSVAVPALIAEDSAVGEALGRSGDEIADRFWPVAGTLLVAWSPFLLTLFPVLVVPPGAAFLFSVLENLPINIGLVAGWHAAVAIYAAGKGDQRLSEVFA